MRKAIYVFRQLFAQLGTGVMVVFMMIAVTSYNLTYWITIRYTHQNILFYAPDALQMEQWAFLNVSLDLLQDDHQTTLLSQAVNRLPGVVQMAESQTFYFPMQDGRVVNVDAYSTPLLNALGMRASQGQRIAWNASVQDVGYPVWVDARLKGVWPIGAAIPLLRSAHEPLLYPGISFYVAGHLNYRNAVVRLSGMQPRSTLEDIMDMSGDVYHMVTVADWMEGLTEYRTDATITRCLQLEGPSKDYIKSLDAEVRSKAIGFCATYQQLLDRYNSTEEALSKSYASTIWFMLPMSVIGLIGLQAILFERLKRLSAVLNLCGMPRSAWLNGWILLLASILLVPTVLGFWAFVVLQRLNIVYPLTMGLPARIGFLLPVGMILYTVCFLSVLPTIWCIRYAKPINLLREADQ